MKVISQVLYKLLTILVAIPVGRAIKKLIERGWTVARPENPPKNPKKADVGWGDALIWAAISGVGAALGKVVTAKGAAGAWRAMIGTEPPGMKKVPATKKVS